MLSLAILKAMEMLLIKQLKRFMVEQQQKSIRLKSLQQQPRN
jgi:hypothetical protein